MEQGFGSTRLQNKVALVAGGGQWIGRAICLRLAEEGCDVIVDDVQGEKAAKVAEECRAFGRRAISFDVDCTDFNAVKGMVEAAEKEMGRIDIVVNNIGGGPLDFPNNFYTSMPDSWEYVIAKNLYTAMNTSRCVINQMKARGWGRIINTSSGAGLRGCEGETEYCAAKAAVHGFTMGLSHEVKNDGIRVNCVVVAPCGDDPSKGIQCGMTYEELLERDKTRMNLPRHGKPEEIAALVAFLASNEGDWINGQIYETGGKTI